MLDQNGEARIHKYLKDLREADRKDILATRGADWREELPIMEALARAEREQGDGQGGGDNLSLLGMFEPIEVSLQQSMAAPEPPPPTTPAQPSSPDIPALSSPELSTLPEVDDFGLGGQQEPMPAAPSLDPAETLSSVSMEAPESSPSPASTPTFQDKVEAANTPPPPNRSQEKIEARREAFHKRANIPVPPRNTQRSRGRDPIVPGQVQPEHTMPFFQGASFIQQPDAFVSDGQSTPHDIAQAASLAGDTTEMTTLMLGETLERIVNAMLKLQVQMNNISTVLERSFNS